MGLFIVNRGRPETSFSALPIIKKKPNRVISCPHSPLLIGA
jgi:hypothetical protein